MPLSDAKLIEVLEGIILDSKSDIARMKAIDRLEAIRSRTPEPKKGKSSGRKPKKPPANPLAELDELRQRRSA